MSLPDFPPHITQDHLKADHVDPGSMVRPPRPPTQRPPAGIGVGRSGEPAAPMLQQVSWGLFAALLFVALLALFADAGGSDQTVTTAGNGTASNAGPVDGNAVDGDVTQGDANAEASAPADGSTQFTLVVGGDVIVHESVAESARAAEGFDFANQFAQIAPVVASADLAVCHLEVTLSSDNTDLEYYPAFRVPNQLADGIAGAGFDACSTASNHSLDAGPVGVANTLDQLDRVGLKHTGTARSATEATTSLLLPTASGLTVGWLSYAYGFNGQDVPSDQTWLANTIDADRIERDAAASRAAGADFVAVSMHWGLEYQVAPTEQQSELPARLLASPNIDLLVGHHAHVVQTVQKFGSEYAILGLGNLLSNQSPETCGPECPIGTEDGVLLRLTVTQSDEGTIAIEAIESIPTWVDRSDGHRIVEAPTDSAARTRNALGPEVT